MRIFGLLGIVLWIGFMGICARLLPVSHLETIYGYGKTEYRYYRVFALVVFLPVILWAGFRTGSGYADTNAYISMYSHIPSSLSGIIGYLDDHPKDPGFSVFLCLIKSIFGENYTPFLLLTALIEGFAVVCLYRKYSSHYIVSIFLFVASAEYFSWMFNGIRQFLAVSITMLAFPLLLKKKYIKYVLAIGVACTVHMTAIMMIPIVFIVTGKPWNRKTLLLIAVGVFAIVMTDRFSDILSAATQNTQYEEAVSSWTEMGDDGTNPVRVIVYAIPTILAFFGRKRLEEENNQVINVCINMSIFSTVLWLISMVTSGIYMGRLPIYVSVYNYILLPFELEVLFPRTKSRVIKSVMIVFYLLYYFYQLYFIWGII